MNEGLQTLFDELRDDLDRESPALAARRLADLAASEVADLFALLGTDERILLVRQMPAEQAASVLAEIDDRSLTDVLEILQDREIVELLDTLPSDDAADLVSHLDEEDQDRVIEMLDRVDHQDAVELKELLRYPEDTAGGVMAKEYLSIPRDRTVGAVQEALRRMDEAELDSMHFGFVVDSAGHLVGQVSLLKLLLSAHHKTAAAIMDPDPIRAQVTDDQEQVANLFVRHDLVSLPVVDSEDRLIGRITVDDAMDVLEEEATEDVARLSRFEETLRTRVILTFFIPMVMATGGNTGIQTSSIMIRMLVTHDLDRRRAGRHLLREFLVAMVIGLLLGALMVVTLLLWKHDADLGFVIGLSLMSVVLISGMVGSTVPLLCDRFGIDPTLATGPFITTTNDVFGLMVYLAIAHQLLQVW
jgi:magnesium transporter